MPPRTRWMVSLRRAGYLFILAFAFRLQLWMFSWGQSPSSDLLRVDVLNCMGFSLAIMSVMSLFSDIRQDSIMCHFGTGDRLRVTAGIADSVGQHAVAPKEAI